MPRSHDTFNVVVLDAVALLGLVIAWVGVSGATQAGRQWGYVSLGVASVALTGLANAIFIVERRRRITSRLSACTARYSRDRPENAVS